MALAAELRDIPVTHQMIVAGRQALRDTLPEVEEVMSFGESEEFVVAIYRAMLAKIKGRVEVV